MCPALCVLEDVFASSSIGRMLAFGAPEPTVRSAEHKLGSFSILTTISDLKYGDLTTMSSATANPSTVGKGLEGVSAGETSICAVDQTSLIYRGYEIADLARTPPSRRLRTFFSSVTSRTRTNSGFSRMNSLPTVLSPRRSSRTCARLLRCCAMGRLFQWMCFEPV